MTLFLAALGGVVVGIVFKRMDIDLPTRFILNAVILALVIAQTILSLLRFSGALPAEAVLIVLIVLWGVDMVFSWHSD
ncbi:MAG: hypothetical protein ACOX3A_02620 [bacterium]